MNKKQHLTKTLVSVGTALLATLLLGACEKQEMEPKASVARPVNTAVVRASSGLIRRTYPAVVLPAQKAELSFNVSGRLTELNIRASGQVEKGQVLAQIDRREYESAVTQLETQVEQANAKLTAMKTGDRSEDLAAQNAKLKAARAQFNAQQAQVNRLKQLILKGTIARVDLDKEQAKLASDRANLDVAQQELKKAQSGARAEDIQAQESAVRGLESQLTQARADLEDTTLRAPFTGVIASREIENLTSVQENSVIAVLQKLKSVDLQFDVPGVDVAMLGQQKNIVTKARLDAAPDQEYTAELEEFDTQADPSTQTFRGRVSIGQPGGITILPGMTGSIIVTVNNESTDQLTVPEAALASEPDGAAFVWVVNPSDNTVSKRRVSTRELAADKVSVTGDVKDGDVVVTAGVSFLREGMAVKPTSNSAE